MDNIKPTMFLDAQTKTPHLRCTAFTSDLKTALEDFKEWVEINKLTNNNLWYAQVFSLPNSEHLYDISILADGSIRAESNEEYVNPYKRNRFVARLRGWK